MAWVLKRETPERQPEHEDWQFSFLEGQAERHLRYEEIKEKTVMELINGPYILKMDLPNQGRVYFAGSDEPYLKLSAEGKTVKWLHDLFESFRQDLIRKGFPQNTNIYGWSLQHLWTNQAAIEVFPGSKVEVRE